jgi:hypothetical protein
MPTITPNDAVSKLPVNELAESLETFLQPLTERLPDARLPAVARLMVQGIIASESPIVTQIARGARKAEERVLMNSQRGYRFLANERLSYRTLLKGLYAIGQRTVATRGASLPRLVVAIDPVNFEKPYAHKTEGVSRVMKSRPPDADTEKRIVRGYPAITATLVNLPQPVTSYAQWFSYQTADFISVNRQIERAVRVTRVLFPGKNLRFVADAEMDDQKFFPQVARVRAEFVARVTHTERLVEVCNARTQAWETTSLGAAASKVFLEFARRYPFTHAGKTRHVSLRFGRLALRLPETHQALWVLVIRAETRGHDLLLITNVPLTSQRVMREVYEDWRLRGRIEHGYRFDQEQGLDVEDVRVHTLERMRRLFVLVLAAAQFVCFINGTWPVAALLWLRELGGKLGQACDRDGLYVLLRGIADVWRTLATLRFLAYHQFPRGF